MHVNILHECGMRPDFGPHLHCFAHRGYQILTASSMGTPALRSTSARTSVAFSQLQEHSVP